MKNFFKKQISREQLAELLYYFAKKFGVDFVDHEMAKENTPFKKANKKVFAHERLVMIFWIIDKFFADKERKLTADIHKKHFADLGILNNSEESKKEISFIMNRYKEYYDAWNDKGSEQFILGGIIAKNILQEEKMVLDVVAMHHIIMDVYALVKHIRESIFNQYEVVD